MQTQTLRMAAVAVFVAAVSFGGGVQVGQSDPPPVQVTERAAECMIRVLPAQGRWEVRRAATDSEFYATQRGAEERALDVAAGGRALVEVRGADGRIAGYRC